MRTLGVMALMFLLAGLASAGELQSVNRQDGQAVALQVYPVDRHRCRGVVVISHGAGGSEAGYAYLAQALAARDWLAIVPYHAESGREALRGYVRQSGLQDGLSRLISTSAAYQGRFMDIAAAREWGQQRCDSARAVLIGHSMGAATAMIEAGAKNHLGLAGRNDFDQYVALSPQGEGAIFPPQAWQGISKPVLLLTGTRDDELGGKSWQTRLQPFQGMSPGCKWLGVIDGATHMNFAGRGLSEKTESLTVKTVLAFLASPPACDPPVEQTGLQLQTK